MTKKTVFKILTCITLVACLSSFLGSLNKKKSTAILRNEKSDITNVISYNEQDVTNNLIQIHTRHFEKKRNAKNNIVEKKPDILLFIADDMTSTACEPYGNKDVHTPNMARLANEGICFDNMNNATAMCGPTRQSLYTGIFPVKNGSYPNHAQVYDNIISMVQDFTKIGYRVALIGKQHYAPMANFPFEYLGGRNSDNGEGIDINLNDAEKFINKDKSKPYLLIVATNQPHSPWNRGNPDQYNAKKLTVPPFLIDTKETRVSLVKYYAEITYADSLLGFCMDMVDRYNNKDNTLMMFTSEHGSSLPFGKWTCYNMGLKAAFIARWPKVIKPNTRTGILTQYIDVLPTLYQCAGGDPKSLRGDKDQKMSLDGSSFYDAFTGKNNEVRKYVYGVHTTRGISHGSDCYPVRSIQDHNYKLIWNLNYKEDFLSSGSRPGNKLYESWLNKADGTNDEIKRAKLYRNRPEFELYDIKNDPYELKNLADDNSMKKTKEKLLSELQSWMNEQGDKGIETEWKALTRLKGDTTNWKEKGD